MKKMPQASESRALAPLKQSLPATFGAVNVGEAPRAGLEASFHKRQALATSNYRAEFVPGRYISFFGLGATAAVPVVAATDPVISSISLFLSVPMGLVSAVMIAMVIREQSKFQKQSVERRQDWVEETLQPEFEKAQKEAYNAQKLQLIAAAERHLANGGVLGMEDGAWLANLDPKTIANTTDQLAITVLQIRKMMAHERCASFSAEGSKAIAKPVSFASQSLDCSNVQHRTYLRKQLLDEDAALAEDSYPLLQKGELAEEQKLTNGFGAALKSYLIPFYARNVRKEYANASLPRFKDIEPQLLAPVDDFAAALEKFESQNRSLDLPALRGWKSVARKSLPGPRAL